MNNRFQYHHSILPDKKRLKTLIQNRIIKNIHSILLENDYVDLNLPLIWNEAMKSNEIIMFHCVTENKNESSYHITDRIINRLRLYHQVEIIGSYYLFHMNGTYLMIRTELNEEYFINICDDKSNSYYNIEEIKKIMNRLNDYI